MRLRTHMRARVRRRVRAQVRTCHSAKGSCNPTRLLEAAELLEADQRNQQNEVEPSRK